MLGSSLDRNPSGLYTTALQWSLHKDDFMLTGLEEQKVMGTLHVFVLFMRNGFTLINIMIFVSRLGKRKVTFINFKQVKCGFSEKLIS